MDQRNRLEHALAKDVWDEQLHRVYADWLEEYTDEVELTTYHRTWTKEWEESKQWLERFARMCREEDGETEKMIHPDIEDIVEVGQHFLDTGNKSSVGFLGFGATNQFYEYATVEEYWTHWQRYTRKTLENPPTREPFGCCI
jgi:hypothetical protein